MRTIGCSLPVPPVIGLFPHRKWGGCFSVYPHISHWPGTNNECKTCFWAFQSMRLPSANQPSPLSFPPQSQLVSLGTGVWKAERLRTSQVSSSSTAVYSPSQGARCRSLPLWSLAMWTVLAALLMFLHWETSIPADSLGPWGFFPEVSAVSTLSPAEHVLPEAVQSLCSCSAWWLDSWAAEVSAASGLRELSLWLWHERHASVLSRNGS